ncbi:MAG: ATP-binding protein [Nitrospirota bacterium]
MAMLRLNGVLGWVLLVGILVVVATVAVLNLLDQFVIERSAAQDRHDAFLRIAESVNRIVSKSGDVHNVGAIKQAFEEIFELRPGILRLSVFEVSPASSALIYSSNPQNVPEHLNPEEHRAVFAGHTVTHFVNSPFDRAWLITAPLMMDGQVVGALRGRFSIGKYDQLIRRETELAKDVGVGAVLITSLAFLILIRVQVHDPIRQLLTAMRRAEAGELAIRAPVTGPSDLREVANQFNRMLERVREAIAAKEHLLAEVQGFNDALMAKIVEAKDELQRANQTLVEARAQTERAEKLAALGELSAVVAHELGNPLNAISGYLQLLAKEPDSLARQRHLAFIRCEIARMIATIQHILDSTRVQVTAAPVDLNRVVQEVITLISPGLAGRRIVVKAELDPVLPPVAGDRRALHGVMFNLATNAVQAMPLGGELRIYTERVFRGAIEGHVILAGRPDLADDAVRLSVGDTGQGIAPEHLARIFEPFFTTRQSEGGTGLGLAICQRVISSLGGRLIVRSGVGQGTTVVVDLPVLKTSTVREN